MSKRNPRGLWFFMSALVHTRARPYAPVVIYVGSILGGLRRRERDEGENISGGAWKRSAVLSFRAKASCCFSWLARYEYIPHQVVSPT